MIRSKAQTLNFLENKTKKSKILPLLIFKADEDKQNILSKVKKKFNCDVIIRSSSVNEDTEYTSSAGLYKSILNVDIKNDKVLLSSVDEVLSSFNKNSLHNEEVLVQPMLKNVIASGVVFTADIDTLSSYYIINYDMSSSTTSVTDGKGKNLKTYVAYKDKEISDNPFLMLLINAVKEVESLLGNNYLDIEFGFDGKDIYIFQARPIVKKNKLDLSSINLDKALYKLHKKIDKLNNPHPNLLGDYTMYGVMPDWNPAEIIGKKPKTLSLSLYKELITDNIWAYQRDNYGYRNLRSHPILVSLLGVAYIDIRVSFNSFIPKNLNKKTANKLVNFYLNSLKDKPSKHDKIEFDIVLSCLDFSSYRKLNNMIGNGFNSDEINEIEEELRVLTNNVFTLYKIDLKKTSILNEKYNDIVSSNLSDIDKIYWLNEYCKRYGTLPFSGLARSAFIAISFLKSFVTENIISEEEYSKFLNSINTISSELNNDFLQMSKKEFLEKYGHLRPGTYEITSGRYDENYDEYFKNRNILIEEKISFEFNQEQVKRINQHLITLNIKINAEDLISFIIEAIKAREFSKFIFTKSLSKILVYIENLGNKFDIKKEDMSFINYKTILSLYSSLEFDDLKVLFKEEIKKNKESYKITQGIKLPDLLRGKNELYSFHNLQNSPNFITLEKVTGQIIKEEEISDNYLENKIICIKSADPGYDFLFTKNIGGLITCYGGANSHMAIRCAELNIPAVIGIGENEYVSILSFNYISIDCKVEKIKKIR